MDWRASSKVADCNGFIMKFFNPLFGGPMSTAWKDPYVICQPHLTGSYCIKGSPGPKPTVDVPTQGPRFPLF